MSFSRLLGGVCLMWFLTSFCKMLDCAVQMAELFCKSDQRHEPLRRGLPGVVMELEKFEIQSRAN